jgi:hypothetical protein
MWYTIFTRIIRWFILLPDVACEESLVMLKQNTVKAVLSGIGHCGELY